LPGIHNNTVHFTVCHDRVKTFEFANLLRYILLIGERNILVFVCLLNFLLYIYMEDAMHR